MLLLRSEVRRLVSRRMVFWIALVLLGYALMVVVLNAANSDKASLNPNDAMRTTQLWLSQRNATRLGVGTTSMIATISVFTYMTVVLLGASAVGAEYRAGTVTTVLTWEPRRIRLLVTRLAAAAIVSMALFLLIHAAFVAGWAGGAELQGVTTGADTHFRRDLALVVLRGTLLAGVFAVVSGALATVGRNTAAALSLWFAYLVVIEGILRAQVSDSIPWLLTTSAAVFYGWDRIVVNDHSLLAGAGTLHLALYVIVIGAVAVTVFRRRDVT